MRIRIRVTYQHSVGLIKHEEGHSVESHNSHLHEVNQSTWSRDQNIDSISEDVLLLVLGHSSVDGGGGDLAGDCEFLTLGINLHG